MPIPRNQQQLPWPTAHLCSDGVVRDLETFRFEQWPDKFNQRCAEIAWHGERSSIAHSLGRKSLPEISAMTGSDRPETLLSW